MRRSTLTTSLCLLAALHGPAHGIIICTETFPPIPEIWLEETPLENAIEFLQKKSVELDVRGPEKKGITFLVDNRRVSQKELAKTVTFHGKNISIQEVLEELTRQTGIAFVVLDTHILVTSAQRAKELSANGNVNVRSADGQRPQANSE